MSDQRYHIEHGCKAQTLVGRVLDEAVRVAVLLDYSEGDHHAIAEAMRDVVRSLEDLHYRACQSDWLAVCQKFPRKGDDEIFDMLAGVKAAAASTAPGNGEEPFTDPL